ncbi:MAG: hypothetical protein IKQ49_02365 [Eubacterium sp.]|nr:hypothetical protein [Eubacterium sp.]
MRKQILAGILLLLLGALCGCGASKENKYETYVRSMISAVYQGSDYDSYCKATGISREEAEAAHKYVIQRLADNLCRIYSLDLEGNEALEQKLLGLSGRIYENIRFEVAPTRKEGDNYYVDVTLYPMEFLSGTNEKLEAYVTEYDSKVSAGEYNDVEKEEYQRSFASGVIETLETAAESVTYGDAVTVTVRIIESKNTYAVSETDLKSVDAALLSSVAPSGNEEN